MAFALPPSKASQLHKVLLVATILAKARDRRGEAARTGRQHDVKVVIEQPVNTSVDLFLLCAQSGMWRVRKISIIGNCEKFTRAYTRHPNKRWLNYVQKRI